MSAVPDCRGSGTAGPSASGGAGLGDPAPARPRPVAGDRSKGRNGRPAAAARRARQPVPVHRPPPAGRSETGNRAGRGGGPAGIPTGCTRQGVNEDSFGNTLPTRRNRTELDDSAPDYVVQQRRYPATGTDGPESLGLGGSAHRALAGTKSTDDRPRPASATRCSTTFRRPVSGVTAGYLQNRPVRSIPQSIGDNTTFVRSETRSTVW